MFTETEAEIKSFVLLLLKHMRTMMPLLYYNLGKDIGKQSLRSSDL